MLSKAAEKIVEIDAVWRTAANNAVGVAGEEYRTKRVVAVVAEKSSNRGGIGFSRRRLRKKRRNGLIRKGGRPRGLQMTSAARRKRLTSRYCGIKVEQRKRSHLGRGPLGSLDSGVTRKRCMFPSTLACSGWDEPTVHGSPKKGGTGQEQKEARREAKKCISDHVVLKHRIKTEASSRVNTPYLEMLRE